MSTSIPRPAETTSVVAGAFAALLAGPLGLDTAGEVAALAIVLGAIPGVVTWFVSRRWRRSERRPRGG